METRRIEEIKIGERCRKDLGDIKALAASVKHLGLLQPIVIRPDNSLVGGVRRLAAVRNLGWTEIAVHVANALEDELRFLEAERDENTCRKDLLPSEIDAMGLRMERSEEPGAEERRGTRTDLMPADLRKTFTEVDAGRVKAKVGSAIAGVSHVTYGKIREVCNAARKDPEIFAPLVEEMDRTGKVDGAYRKLNVMRDEAATLAVEAPEGKYRTIVIDPPWDHGNFSVAGRGKPQYAVMSHEDLLALPVAEWADDTCHLYLWTTNNFVPRALELMEAWGFAYKTILTWTKPRIGLGTYFRSSTEHVLFGTRGKKTTRAKDIPTHFEAKTRKHSEKPDKLFAIVERASYPPYLEAFARQARDGWTVWGNVAGANDSGLQDGSCVCEPCAKETQ